MIPAVQSFASLLPISIFGAGERQIFLSTRPDALVLCGGGEYEFASALDTLGELDRPSPARAWKLRQFAASPRVLGTGVSALTDQRLLLLLRERVRAGDLVGVRRSDGSLVGESGGNGEAKRLVRAIEAAAPMGLTHAGRRYKLVVGAELAKTPERDRYQVVGRDEARGILGSMAGQPVAAGKLKDLLPKATEKLSRDWRPPFQPEGLVLLRRMPAQVSAPRAENPITPSAFRKLKDEGWIEIVFVDAGGEPVADVDFDLRLADGQNQSGKTNKKGSARFEGITAGECKVSFPRIEGPVIEI
jgi:hypothetical protein